MTFINLNNIMKQIFKEYWTQPISYCGVPIIAYIIPLNIYFIILKTIFQEVQNRYQYYN